MGSGGSGRLPTAARRVVALGRRTLRDRGGPQPPSFFGVTRFSVFDPAPNAWKLSRNAPDHDSYRSRLWSAERMRLRCDIFLTRTAPILQQMAEQHDYRHLVRYSPEMPDPWRSELFAAAESHPVLHLLEDREGAIGAMGGLLRERGLRSRVVVQFRLDDDDLLAADFLDRLAAYATPHDVGRAVSMAAGYSAVFEQGALGPVRAVRRVFGAQGLAYIGRYDSGHQRVVLSGMGAHYLVDRRVPTIVDSREPAYFQMRHTEQDMLSDQETTGDHAAALQALNAELAKRPRAKDLGAVAKRFPTLRDLL